MKLKAFGAVLTAVLLIAPAVFAQNTDQNPNPSDQQNQGAMQGEGTQAPAGQPGAPAGQPGDHGSMISGKVTAYTPNQSITVKESSGQTRQINLGPDSQVAPDVKVGSRVMISESTTGGHQMVRVETAKAKHGKLPQTASNYPLMGLLGLLSLGAAVGIRIANRKLA